MPPAGEGFSDRVEDPEPGRLSVDGAGRDGLLDQILLGGKFHAGAQDLFHGKRAQDHP